MDGAGRAAHWVTYFALDAWQDERTSAGRGAAGRGVDLAANGCSPSEDGEQKNGWAISSFKMPPSVERAGVIDHADHEPLRKSPKVRVATRWRVL